MFSVNPIKGEAGVPSWLPHEVIKYFSTVQLSKAKGGFVCEKTAKASYRKWIWLQCASVMYYMFGFYGTSCFIWKSGTPLQPIFSIIQPLNVNFNFHRLSTVSVADCLLWNVSPGVAISTFNDTVLSSTLSVVQRSLWYYLKN